MRDVNQKTITALSWYKILPLNGFNHIRAKQRLHKRRKEICRSNPGTVAGVAAHTFKGLKVGYTNKAQSKNDQRENVSRQVDGDFTIS